MFPMPITFARQQPDFVDGVAIFVYVAIVLGAPILGYWLMVIDIRAYFRALKGAIMVVSKHLPYSPAWARQHTPGCLRSLGLDGTCTEEDVKRAYRSLAETLHPDRGGDRQQFLLLQRQFEEALDFIRGSDPLGKTPS